MKLSLAKSDAQKDDLRMKEIKICQLAPAMVIMKCC